VLYLNQRFSNRSTSCITKNGGYAACTFSMVEIMSVPACHDECTS
jgi:hypothetical protein